MEEVVCNSCGAKFEKKRSPRKGYKITQDGCLCDKCYAEQMQTYGLAYGCGKEYHGGYAGIDVALDTMREARQLWNSLVEIDRYDRAEYQRLTTDPALEVIIKEKTEAIDAINATIKKQKMVEQRRKVKVDPALLKQKKQLQAERKPLWEQLKAERHRMREENEDVIVSLQTTVQERITAATAPDATSLSWTMLGPLMDRFKTASSKARKEGAKLRFRRFRGDGIITVPFSNGIRLAECYRDDEVGKFQIASRLMSDHPREKRTLCRIAVRTDNKRPVWVSVPVHFHRPIPEDAVIRTVTLKRYMLDQTPQWRLCLTIRVSKPPDITPVGGAVGINIGWRKRPDGSIRVGYWVDDQGRHSEVLFPVGMMDQYRKLDDLRSIMDKHFIEVRTDVAAQMKELLKTPDLVPPKVKDVFSFIHLWKSPGRMIYAMRVLQENHFPGSEKLRQTLRYWYSGPKVKPDPEWNGHRHLYSWFCNLGDQLKKKRRDMYRNFGANLVREYGTVYMEDFDLRDVLEKPEPEHTEYDAIARYQRTKVAPHELRDCIVNAGHSAGTRYSQVDSKWISHECPTCGEFMKFDAALNITVTCQHCKTVHDQDYVAAINLLRRGQAGGGSPSSSAASA